MLWYDARETGGATERLAFDVPLAARADDGVRFDEGYSVRKADGTYNDLALDRTQQGDFLESLSDAVRQEGSSGQLSWEGEAYHALTIDVTDGMMPNVASPFGGVLRLNVSGDCYVDGGGADYSCFEGFDCVLITGEGSLRFENTAGLECGGGGADWSGAQDGMTWDALTLADAGGGWFAGTLTMENVTAEELLPCGALWLRLAGENTVSGEVGGTGLLVEGDGAISAGNLNLWGWGGIHHPAFALRGATVTTGGFGMGCNSGEAGTFEVSGGSFTCTGETWMQNAAMTVLDGEVRFDGPCNLDSGSVVIEGGTVVFGKGLWLGNGDITVTGGEVIVPGGADGLIAENGSVRIEGGTVREP